MFKDRKTPGVYITELDAFPPGIVGVATAVPVFIGYTQTAAADGKSVALTPVAITSLAAYERVFGGAAPAQCPILTTAQGAEPDIVAPLWNGDAFVGGSFTLAVPIRFQLYNSLRLFFANGGGSCFVVSVGGYDGMVTPEALLQGVKAAGDQAGITLVAVPDAVSLPADGAADGIPTSTAFGALIRAVLAQCAARTDRLALLDLYGTQAIDTRTPTANAAGVTACAAAFRAQTGDAGLGYGAAYFPFLVTTVVQAAEIDYTCFATDAKNLALLASLLTAQANTLYPDGAATSPATNRNPEYLEVAAAIAAMKTTLPGSSPPADAAAIAQLNAALVAALPLLREMEAIVAGKLSLLPPSGAMAGLFAANDAMRGVWNAPANIAVQMVQKASAPIDDQLQGDLNVPLDGKAIDAIRDFPGRGTIVWGARTLDGNSNDWRYIQVRRTIIYIEQSIKSALAPFVFAANDATTWAAVTAMISNFLNGVWSQGGLMGARASEAYTVQCGLGSTMTAQDVLNGYMIVQVTLQMVHPAEFIALTFTQQMQGAAAAPGKA